MFEKYKMFNPLTHNIKCKSKTINNRYVLDKVENKDNFTYLINFFFFFLLILTFQYF